VAHALSRDIRETSAADRITRKPGLAFGGRFKGLGRVWPAIAVVVAAAVLIAPIWAVEIPAMPDIPAHLACFFLLAGGIHNPALAQFYRVDWQFVPNLASEIAVPFLSHIVGLLPATKLFLSAAVALWVLGAAAIQKALYGRVGVVALMAAFFAYNANFFWGFMNYDFAAGLALAIFAAWIATAKWPRAARVSAFAAAVTLLYFCHLFAAAVLMLMIGCFELDALFRARALVSRRTLARGIDMALIVLPSALAFFLLKPKAADGAHLEFNLLSTWDDRIGAAFESRFDQPGYIILGLLGLFWAVGVWRGWLRVHPQMRLVVLALLACVVFMPEWALGGWGVDLRMPAVLGAVAFAAAELRLSPRWQGASAAAALTALALASAAAGGNWHYYDRQYAEFRAALKDSPVGTKIMTVLDGDAMGLASDEPYWHMAEFAILDRSGFSPLLFTTAGQHVVRVEPGFQAIAAATAQQGSPPDVGELGDLAANQVDGDKNIPEEFPYLMLFQCHFDEVVVIRSGGRPSPVPADILRLRHRGSFFDLYDVRRDDACTGP
jgi:hypothetical protein